MHIFDKLKLIVFILPKVARAASATWRCLVNKPDSIDLSNNKPILQKIKRNKIKLNSR